MSLLLDALLLVIIILAVPLGVYRGGIREGLTAAGILLGAQLATEWAVPWGDFIGDHSALATDASRFLVAFLLLLLATLVVGYGSSIAYTYHPGPGGRLFGGVLGLLNAVLFIGFIIDFVIVFLFSGSQPEVIRKGYLSRGLSVGTGTILLIACAFVVGAMIFGMLVREREPDDYTAFQTAARQARREPAPVGPQPADLPPEIESDEAEPAPVQIREIRHWEQPEPEPVEAKLPESQWSQTWPRSSMGPSVQPPWNPDRTRSAPTVVRQPGTPNEETLRDWLERNATGRAAKPDGPRSADPRDQRDDTDG
jgi:uncharacterized membrane protein required for colicin V production